MASSAVKVVISPPKREWDSSYPHVWDKWEQNGYTWIIQDLPPEDEEAAVELLKINQIPDEYLAKTCGIHEDPEASSILCDIYRKFISRRMTLACYKLEGDHKTLVGVNICFIQGEDDDMRKNAEELSKVPNDRLQNLLEASFFMKELCNDCKLLGLNKILSAISLCVAKEYRGFKHGARILNAREPLCRHLGIKATSTTFTGPASQKLAVRCGFSHLMDIKAAQLAEAGIPAFSKDDDRVFKVLYKRYD